uniref:Uncharacterized protein n=1 Tax=Anopheles atroparvus TaxID=41427 RepID=A0A182IWQ0_ANOAO
MPYDEDEWFWLGGWCPVALLLLVLAPSRSAATGDASRPGVGGGRPTTTSASESEPDSRLSSESVPLESSSSLLDVNDDTLGIRLSLAREDVRINAVPAPLEPADVDEDPSAFGPITPFDGERTVLLDVVVVSPLDDSFSESEPRTMSSWSLLRESSSCGTGLGCLRMRRKLGILGMVARKPSPTNPPLLLSRLSYVWLSSWFRSGALSILSSAAAAAAAADTPTVDASADVIPLPLATPEVPASVALLPAPAPALTSPSLLLHSCSSHQASYFLKAVFSIIFLLKSFFRICFSSATMRSTTRSLATSYWLRFVPRPRSSPSGRDRKRLLLLPLSCPRPMVPPEVVGRAVPAHWAVGASVVRPAEECPFWSPPSRTGTAYPAPASRHHAHSERLECVLIFRGQLGRRRWLSGLCRWRWTWRSTWRGLPFYDLLLHLDGCRWRGGRGGDRRMFIRCGASLALLSILLLVVAQLQERCRTERFLLEQKRYPGVEIERAATVVVGRRGRLDRFCIAWRRCAITVTVPRLTVAFSTHNLFGVPLSFAELVIAHPISVALAEPIAIPVSVSRPRIAPLTFAFSISVSLSIPLPVAVAFAVTVPLLVTVPFFVTIALLTVPPHPVTLVVVVIGLAILLVVQSLAVLAERILEHVQHFAHHGRAVKLFHAKPRRADVLEHYSRQPEIALLFAAAADPGVNGAPSIALLSIVPFIACS